MLRGIDSIETHVWERLPAMCRLWPCFSPWNIFDLTVEGYLVFTRALDSYND